MSRNRFESPNPHKLYRNKRKGVVAGVCAGVADYFGIDVAAVRVATILGMIFLTPWFLTAYVVCALIVPVRGRGGETSSASAMSPEEDRFWRDVEHAPHATFSDIRYRFRSIDERLRDIERVVTSDEWKLRRDFREIE